MPATIHLKIKKSEDEIKRLLFDPDLKRASTSRGLGIVNPNASHEWTDVSELRLFSKVVYYKPAGVNRHFNLGRLVSYMNNIFEDEEYCDFAVFLTPEDYKTYLRRRDISNKSDIIIFKPAYKIRPTPEMIMDKLREFYNMQTVENNEYLPEDFQAKCDFTLELAEGREARPSTAFSKDTDRSVTTTPVNNPKRQKGDNSRSGSPAPGIASKKRKALAKDDVSRSASPANPKKQ